jgi:hypothetical protein
MFITHRKMGLHKSAEILAVTGTSIPDYTRWGVMTVHTGIFVFMGGRDGIWNETEKCIQNSY